jgi:hypothetical protein
VLPLVLLAAAPFADDAVLRDGFGCGSIAIGAGPQDMNPQT